MKVKAELSRLTHYKMDTQDIIDYLKERGFDTDRHIEILLVDDGAMIIYEQEVSDGA